ncbi:PKD domain-containing protein [Sediminispirochaeta bajacaliforniensis]|uniref:PKD domain-containing protein n=1 Tax=Sediminispirochaeta bajacaliforniensis TaxID=148 RepID=UPI0003737C05|nr:PKD domain-containing protein [Sediminispirochaeta bajacaliforniensis]
MKRIVIISFFCAIALVFVASVFGGGHHESSSPDNVWITRVSAHRYLYFDSAMQTVKFTESSSTAAAHALPFPIGISLVFRKTTEENVSQEPQFSVRAIGQGQERTYRGNHLYVLPGTYLEVRVTAGIARHESPNGHTHNYTFGGSVTVLLSSEDLHYDSLAPDAESATIEFKKEGSAPVLGLGKGLFLSLSCSDRSEPLTGYRLGKETGQIYDLASGIGGYHLRIVKTDSGEVAWEGDIDASQMADGGFADLLSGYGGSLGGGAYRIEGQVYDKIYTWFKDHGEEELMAGHIADLGDSGYFPAYFYVDDEGPEAVEKVGVEWGSESCVADFSEGQQLRYFGPSVRFTIDDEDIPADRGPAGGLSATMPDGVIEISNSEGNQTGTYSFGDEIDLANGVYTAVIYFFDGAGNKGAIQRLPFGVDSSAPLPPLLKSDGERLILDVDDKGVLFIPSGSGDVIGWYPAVDGSTYGAEPEAWQSGLDGSTYRARITNASGLWRSVEIEHNDDAKLYSMNVSGIPNGEYSFLLSISDACGNSCKSEYHLTVDQAPKPPVNVRLEQEGDNSYIAWEYEGEIPDGYGFWLQVLKGDDPVDQLDEVYTQKVDPKAEGMRCLLPHGLKSKRFYTARVYAKNASGFPATRSVVFHLPNHTAGDVALTVPDEGTVIGPGFPAFSLEREKDDEGDLLGLRVFYRRQGAGPYQVYDPGVAAGTPVRSINGDEDGAPDLGQGIYEWYLEIPEYYHDWDGSLLVWNEAGRWPSSGATRRFAVDGNPPRGVLTVEAETEDTVSLKAFALSDGMGSSASGVETLLLWNGGRDEPAEQVAFAAGSEKALAAQVASGAGVLFPVSSDELAIDWWPLAMDETTGKATARMIVIDKVGNRSETISISSAEDNQAPVVTVMIPEITLRVGELLPVVGDEGERLYAAYDPEGDDLSYAWNFGDETSGEGMAPEKMFMSAGDYRVVLTVSDWWNQESSAEIVVHAVNTSEGELLISETWEEGQRLTGIVVVPEGLSLVVKDGTTVTAVPGAGIEVQTGASLMVEGTEAAPVVCRRADAQEAYWEGILVRGSGSFEHVSISGSKRGVTAGPASAVILSDVDVHENLIGLHLVGASVELSRCRFIGNTWYGIKEDAMAEHGARRPDIGDSVFEDNGNDYYHEELLNLSGSELEILRK